MIWTVFRKEFREIFRDRRTTFNVIVSPLLITPLLLGIMGSVIRRQSRQAEVETYAVGLVGAESAPSIRDALAKAPNLRIENITRAEAERRIRMRELRAAAVLPAEAEAMVRTQRTVPVQILIDPASDTSRQAAGRLQALFAERGLRMVAARLRERGLSTELAQPFRTGEQAIPGGGTAGTFMLAMFLPYVLALSAIMGGVYAANDLVAGEKERGTLETLLVSPASRRDLVMGKFLAVAGVCLVSSFLSVVGLMLPFVVPLAAFDWMAQGGGGLKLSAGAVVVMLLVQLPLAVLGAGVLLVISTFARNQKEAQTYLGPVLIAVSVAAMLSLLLRSEAGLPLALVPVLNAAMVLKQALSGTFHPAFIALAFAASIGYAAMAVLFATRLFQKESVLLKA